jgi:hypothetical protein
MVSLMKPNKQKTKENPWWWFLPLCLVIIGTTAFLWVNVFIILGVASDYGLIPCGNNCQATKYIQVTIIEEHPSESINSEILQSNLQKQTIEKIEGEQYIPYVVFGLLILLVLFLYLQV